MLNYRSIFVSDWHLGTPQCQRDKILQFIKEIDCDNLFLVGDIIDWQYLKKKGFKYWGQTENTIIQKILKMARRGTNVYFFDSNHFLLPPEIINNTLGNIHIIENFVLNEKHYICHGHQFDSSIKCFGGGLAKIGNSVYELLIKINILQRIICNKLNIKNYRTISCILKSKSKSVIKFLNNFEVLAAEKAKQKNLESVIFGHSHQPIDKIIDKIRILNTGAWTDGNCSYVAENDNGELNLYYY